MFMGENEKSTLFFFIMDADEKYITIVCNDEKYLYKWWWKIQKMMMRNTIAYDAEKYNIKWWWETQLQMIMRNTIANDDEKYNCKSWIEIQSQMMMRNKIGKDEEKYSCWHWGLRVCSWSAICLLVLQHLTTHHQKHWIGTYNPKNNRENFEDRVQTSKLVFQAQKNRFGTMQCYSYW